MIPSSPSRPRVALIGISGYGRIHLELVEHFERQRALELVAAVVINAAEERELVAGLRARGCRIHGDHRSMFTTHAGRIDLCLVPTGIHWHGPMTVAALRHGANVLVEKPLCASSAELEEILAAERDSGRFVAVGFQDLYEPATRWLEAELARGAVGRVTRVRFLGVWPRSRGYFARNDWAGRLRLGDRPVFDSPLNNAFAHFVMLSLLFAGAGGAAGAEVLEADLLRAHEIESFDTAVVRARTAGGVELWFGASHAGARPLEPRIEITGTDGTACWHYEREAWWRGPSGRVERRSLLGVSEARRQMMAAALRRLADPGSPVCTARTAGVHTRFIEALHRDRGIRDFPRELVRWAAADDCAASAPEVEGLEAALHEAHRTGSLLRFAEPELGVAPRSG